MRRNCPKKNKGYIGKRTIMTQTMVKINLLGKDYHINCPKGQSDQLRQAVEELEQRITDTQSKTILQSNENILIMTALNMAGDLLEQKATLDLLQTGKKRKIS
jgi:cell division protein ZapA (FtsZ GTPase activity inhibitor)